jgi:hypothetical protein
MNRTTIFRLSILTAFTLAITAVNANADFINVYGWVSTEDVIHNSGAASPGTLTGASCSGGAACTPGNAAVSFSTNGIDFNATDANIATWLASSKFVLNNVVDNAPTTSMTNTIWEFSGNIAVASAAAFTVLHDDGVTFTINGQSVIDVPGSSALSTGTYTGASGDSVPFTLIYANCCGGPAQIHVDLTAPIEPVDSGPNTTPGSEPGTTPGSEPDTTPVPEPSSILLLGTGTAFLGLLTRRRSLSGQ